MKLAHASMAAVLSVVLERPTAIQYFQGHFHVATLCVGTNVR